MAQRRPAHPVCASWLAGERAQLPILAPCTLCWELPICCYPSALGIPCTLWCRALVQYPALVRALLKTLTWPAQQVRAQTTARAVAGASRMRTTGEWASAVHSRAVGRAACAYLLAHIKNGAHAPAMQQVTTRWWSLAWARRSTTAVVLAGACNASAVQLLGNTDGQGPIHRILLQFSYR